MQRLALTLLAVGTAIAAALAFNYRNELLAKTAEVKALAAQLDTAKRAQQAVLDETTPLRENVARLTAERDRLKAGAQASAALGADLSKPPLPGAPDAAKPADGGKEMMGGIAKMFQTEEGKKMLRSQTEMMLRMQYTDLAKKLKLSPQETELVMGLLADRQTALAGETFGAFSGDKFDETKMKDLGEKAKASRKEYDEKLKTLLGDERFKDLETYDRTLGERMVLSQLEPQFSAAGAPLEGTQKDSLLRIMSQERAKQPKSPFAQDNTDPVAALTAMKDDAAVERWTQQEQEFQQRVLQSAAGTLNPDQINTLRQGFQQQTEMQKFGLKMSREMFKGGDGGAIVIPGPPPR